MPTTPTTPAGPPDWAALRGRLTGELLLPQDAGYDAARRPFNTVFETHRPVAIARCAGPDDVKASLEAARGRVPIAARSGGHSYAGYSTPDGGLMVDVGPMAQVDVRPDGTAVIGAGTRLIDVYTALAAQGRALPAGSCPSVGIAGLTLGGGLGVLNRLHGLTCDRLRSAEVVLPDGTSVTAGPDGDADLFWALRGGGGGNFGVVTAFTFETVAAADVTVFSLRFPAGSGPELLGAWQEWAPGAPDELWSMLGVQAGRPPSVRVGGCFVGAQAALNGLLGDLQRRAGAQLSNRFVQPMDHLEAMRYFAGCSRLSPQDCRMSDPTPFVGSSRIVAAPMTDPTAVVGTVDGRTQVDLLFDSLGGAVGRIPVDATAFPHRTAIASIQVYGRDRATVTEVQRALAPLAGNGAYINYIDPQQQDWRDASYGPNLPRLRDLATRYDPDRVLAFPQGIGS